METQYAKLKSDPSLLPGKNVSVTGYSLGGHLATTVNVIHPGGAQQVVTFNGAGSGKIGDGSLEDIYEKLPLIIERFQELREQAAAIGNLEGHFTTTEALTAYCAIKVAMAADGGASTDSTLGWTIANESAGILEARLRAELQLRGDALIAAIEADRAASLTAGTGCGWKHRHPT